MPKYYSTARMSPFMRKCVSGKDQFAKTPVKLLEQLEEEYGKFDFDPCPPDPAFDGLSSEWGQNNYVNPPYNALEKWLEKAVEEWEKDKQVIFLMPIRIHTSYFHRIVGPHLQSGAVSMYVIEGGVVFQGYKHKSPFGVMYLVFPGKKLNPLGNINKT